MASTNTKQLLWLAAIAAGLYVYSDAKGLFKPKPLTQEQARSLTEKAGYKILPSTPDATRVEVPGGFVEWSGPADLRRWERALLVADRYVPGTWLSRSVLL